MSRFNPYLSGTSALLALSMMTGATAPIMMTAPASAQLFPPQRVTIPYGTTIPVMYDQAEKIVVTPTETMPITLKVAANIKSRSGTILIPAGSEVVGELQPANGGSQFVAEELVIYGNRRQPIDATSQVITQTEEINRGTNTGSILKGAAIGAAAATAISVLTGDNRAGILEVLGGAGLGAVGGVLLGRNKTEVVVINPDTDLNLTLRSSLALR
ncbi:MAG: hypothetical protein KME08_07795 [Aphanothece sp. CMT-3BRIN-NPC111]|jgi:hypothetical protein|nr:hypothetical protein [Aphanothece sp. CMT-3BRIN-NPC111]